MTTNNLNIAIVSSQYNQSIVNRLKTGCLDVLINEGINKDNILWFDVPGAFEIPVMVKKILVDKKPNAVITLGAVIRGETPHFDVIVNSCSAEIARLGTEHVTPVIFGVLTVDTIEQAMDRSGDEESNKGAEAASTALQMVEVLKSV